MSSHQHSSPKTQGLQIVDTYSKKNRSSQQVKEDRAELSKRGVAVGIIILMVTVFVIIFTGGFDRSLMHELNTVSDKELSSMTASQISEELSKAQNLAERGKVHPDEVMPHVERLYDALEERTEDSITEWKTEEK